MKNKDFEILYKDYFPRIYAFLYKLTGNYTLAEDLTQETFFQAFCSLYRFRGESDIFTWLCAIAKHVYYRNLRKNKNFLETVSMETLLESLQETTAPVEEAVEQRFLAESAKKALLKLPKKYQDVMILRVYAEMKYAEIGETLHISENSARVRYHRAKKTILEMITHDTEL